MTTSAIEPATYRYVAQRLNHCATADSPTHLLVNDKKLKGPTNVANFFVKITKIFNIRQIKNLDTVSVLKDSCPGNLSSIKIIPIIEAEIKIIIRSVKARKSSG